MAKKASTAKVRPTAPLVSSSLLAAIEELVDAKVAVYDCENNPKTGQLRGPTYQRLDRAKVNLRNALAGFRL